MVTCEATDDLEEVEIRLLLEGIFRYQGYDFRDYIAPMLKRRVWQFVREEKVRTVSGLQERALHDPDCMARFVQSLCINVSAMFRDPRFFLALRRDVLPRLRTYPFIRIWHAGCATGEEVYSMAILLQEEGLYERCRIYATDINASALANAKAGIVSLAAMKESSRNYFEGGGKGSLSDHYTVKGENAILTPGLLRKIVFAQHNLVTDSSFNEFNFICCRNVLIYFNKALQERVRELFHQSLVMFGVLGLGSKESIEFTSNQHCYQVVDREQKLYRKVRE